MYFSASFYFIFARNLVKTCKKHGKQRFRPEFGVRSTQTLIEIYNKREREGEREREIERERESDRKMDEQTEREI